MKKILSLGLVALFLCVPVVSVLGNQTGYQEIPLEGDLIPTIQTIANWLFSLLMAGAAIAIVAAAFIFVSAGGDPEKVGQARTWVIYALVGVILALLSQVLVNWAGSMIQ